MEWEISLCDLDYGAEEAAAVAAVLQRKWLTMAEEVNGFEAEFAGSVGVKHAIAVSNGTAALHLAYLALGIGPGDELIQPAINFVAAANMTLACGAMPRFADILALDEPTLDPAEVECLITSRTRGVVVMHYGGYLCRMAEIRDICRAHNLALIEDACHAVGAQAENGTKAGNLGDIGCFSFFSNKNLAVGEGGMVTTNRDDLAEKVRRLRSHGMTTLTWDRHRGHASRYDVAVPGYNYRPDEIRAALGRVQLRKLARNNALREALSLVYRHHLDSRPGWLVPFARAHGGSAYHLMVALAPDEAARDQAGNALRAARIQTSLHYPCIPDFAAYQACRERDLPKSREFARRAITLPLFPGMSAEQVEMVVNKL